MVLKFALLLAGSLLLAAPPGPLDELNATFREQYAAARAEAYAHQGLVLLVSGDSLYLYRDQKVVAEAVVRPPSYHRLKAIDHVPLAVRLLVKPWGEGPLAPDRAGRLAAFRSKLLAVPGAASDPVLAASLKYLDGVLAANRVSRSDLDAYSRAVEPSLAANLDAAAAVELETLDAAVGAWRKTLPAADWDRVAVVVIGSHMAREGELSWQYFSRLLGQQCEGGRLVYAEEKWQPEDALKLLASHVVDLDLGGAFFGDPGRMHRDVLGDGAKKWLDSHPPTR